MRPTISKTYHPPLVIDNIEEFERKMDINIPPSYRSFLLTNNGGKPNPDGFMYLQDKKEYRSCVHRFLGIHEGEYSNLETYLKTYADRLPKDMFPIAHDPGGNLICIKYDDFEQGVFFWDHENEALEGLVPWNKNLHKIADTFDLFLESLTIF